jgi:hypothetical protein
MPPTASRRGLLTRWCTSSSGTAVDHPILEAHARVMTRRGRQTINDSVGTTGTAIRLQGQHKAGPQSHESFDGKE